jgi:hypothetical protein
MLGDRGHHAGKKHNEQRCWVEDDEPTVAATGAATAALPAQIGPTPPLAPVLHRRPNPSFYHRRITPPRRIG